MALEYKLHAEPSFVDKRGTITNVFEAREDVPPGPIYHMAFITSQKGAVRGNHYHKLETQYIYLVRGEFLAYSCPVIPHVGRLRGIRESGMALQRVHVLPGDLLITPPLVAHKHVYTKQSWLVNLNTAPRKKLEQEDTYPFKVTG